MPARPRPPHPRRAAKARPAAQATSSRRHTRRRQAPACHDASCSAAVRHERRSPFFRRHRPNGMISRCGVEILNVEIAFNVLLNDSDIKMDQL